MLRASPSSLFRQNQALPIIVRFSIAPIFPERLSSLLFRLSPRTKYSSLSNLLNKSDLADAACNKAWMEYFKQKGFHVLEVNAKTGAGIKGVQGAVKEACKENKSIASSVICKISSFMEPIKARFLPTSWLSNFGHKIPGVSSKTDDAGEYQVN